MKLHICPLLILFLLSASGAILVGCENTLGPGSLPGSSVKGGGAGGSGSGSGSAQIIPKFGNLPGAAADYFYTPDSVANSFTGDLDIRIKISLDNWTDAQRQVLISRNNTNFADRGPQIMINGTGPDGNSFLTFTYAQAFWSSEDVTTNAGIGAANGTSIWVRVTFAENNGGGNHESNVYTSTDYNPDAASTNNGTWVAVGTTNPLIVAGVYTLTDSSSPILIGGQPSNNDPSLVAGTADYRVTGKAYRAQWISGIHGTVISDFNPTDWSSGSSWTSSKTGEVWYIHGAASVCVIATGC